MTVGFERGHLLVRRVEAFHEDNAPPATFADMLMVRRDAYRGRYQPTFLPYSKIDFVSDHYVYYVREGDRFIPAGVLSYVRDAVLNQYGLHDPITETLADGASPRHAQAIRGYKQRFSPEAIKYSGSFAIASAMRRRRDLAARIVQLMNATMVNEMLNHGARGIYFASVPRLGTDAIFRAFGGEPLADAEGPLPPVVRRLNGEPIELMFLDTPSELALAHHQAHAHLFSGADTREGGG